MEPNRIDNLVSTVVVAYDAETGEVVYLHEQLIEVPLGASAPRSSCDAELETEIREEARKCYPQRRIETLVADSGDIPEEGMRFEVELACRKIRKIADDRARYLSR